MLVFGLGVFMGIFIDGVGVIKKPEHEYRDSSNKLPFINPLLECSDYEITELKSFKEKIINTTEDYKQRGSIREASVYFRELNNGLWIAMGEDEIFAPASLLKLPLAMSYLKKAETNPLILEEKVLIKEEYQGYLEQNFKPKKTVEVGKEYAVAFLIKQMIVHSDNVAKDVLFNKASDYWDTAFNDLGIKFPEKESDFLRVRDYARFFRVLYNGSYLTKTSSNYLLDLLSEVDFSGGIVAGVPEGVIVSHKFGERLREDGIRQLHDCGIVYAESNPYLLCVMTRGDDYVKLSEYIKHISNVVYDEVASQRGS